MTGSVDILTAVGSWGLLSSVGQQPDVKDGLICTFLNRELLIAVKLSLFTVIIAMSPRRTQTNDYNTENTLYSCRYKYLTLYMMITASSHLLSLFAEITDFIAFGILENIGLHGFEAKIRQKIIPLFLSF